MTNCLWPPYFHCSCSLTALLPLCLSVLLWNSHFSSLHRQLRYAEGDHHCMTWQLRDTLHPILLHLPDNILFHSTEMFPQISSTLLMFLLYFPFPISLADALNSHYTEKRCCKGRKLMKFLYLNQSYFLPSSPIEKDIPSFQTIKQHPPCPWIGLFVS